MKSKQVLSIEQMKHLQELGLIQAMQVCVGMMNATQIYQKI